MGLFGNLQNEAKAAEPPKETSFEFAAIPADLAEFTALAQAAMKTPFETAAMTVIALCAYPHSNEHSIKMLDFLRGPRPLNGAEIGFIDERFKSCDYIPRSYLGGATPKNGYIPDEPYTVTVFDDFSSYQEKGYARVFIRSSGADTPREVITRQAKDGKWYLWDHALMVRVSQPDSSDFWA